jgi:MFS family permease
MLAALANHPLRLFPSFRKLYVARVISAMGDKFFTIALAWWVLQTVDVGAERVLGFLMAAHMLPVALSGALVGPIVESRNRRWCLVAADVARCALVALLTWLLLRDGLTLPWVFAIVALAAAWGPVFESSADSSLESLVPRERLASAASINSSIIELSNVCGGFLGSVLLALVGIAGAFMFNSVSFLVSALFVIAIPGALARPRQQLRYGNDLKAGVLFLWRRRDILSLTVVFGFFNFFSGPLYLYIPLLVKDVLGLGIGWVAVLEGSLAAGALVATAGLSFLDNVTRPYRWISFGMAATGTALALVGLLPQRGLLVVFLFAIGVFIGVINALSLSIFQLAVPSAYKGRFFATLSTVVFGAVPLAFALNGIAAEAWGLTTALVVNGTAAVFLAGIVPLLPRPAPEGPPRPLRGP